MSASDVAIGLAIAGGSIMGYLVSFIVFPIVYLLPHTIDGFDTLCNLSNFTQPEFRVLSFSTFEHSSLDLEIGGVKKWPAGVSAGFYDPQLACKGDFVSTHNIQVIDMNCSSGRRRTVGFYSLSRGSVVEINLTALHSIALILVRRNDLDFGDTGNVYSRFKENYTRVIHGYDGLYTYDYYYDDNGGHFYSFSNSMKKYAIFRSDKRKATLSWTVPETTQYAIMFGNDSPFTVTVFSCNITLKSPSPITNTPISLCKTHDQKCTLSVPSTYTGKNISLVIYNDCSRTDPIQSEVRFDMSLTALICMSVFYFFPGALGVIFLLIAPLICCCEDFFDNCCGSRRRSRSSYSHIDDLYKPSRYSTPSSSSSSSATTPGKSTTPGSATPGSTTPGSYSSSAPSSAPPVYSSSGY